MSRRELAVSVSYDRVPYPSLSYSPTHPDRLATVAKLVGMDPAPVERCRVLELGCAAGGNLLPMAYALPESEFVGIDLSARQLAEGQQVIDALQLGNIELKHLDILDVDASLGQFDYIIAHGVYSWVQEPVQDKTLEVCRQNLAPDGVAYVSYNTYPGWHMFNIVRDIMLYHTREIDDPETRVSKARGFLNFLAEKGPGEASAYGSFLQAYVQLLEGGAEDKIPKSDSALLHDELEKHNEPVYFYQFAERAARFGLQYLAEAEFSEVVRSNVPLETRKTLDEMATSRVELEQYMDFLQNRTFRKSLLCHQDVVLGRKITPETVMDFHIASRAGSEVAEPDITSKSVVEFSGRDGAVLSTDHPISKAAMLCLADVWPATIPFAQLLAAARVRLGQEAEAQVDREVAGSDDGDQDPLVLATNLLRAYSYSDSLVELHSYAPPFVREASERPVASALVRFQAQNGQFITNLRHERMALEGFDRFLLQHLDGSRDRAALVDLLMSGPVAEGTLTVEKDGQDIADTNNIQDLLEEEIDGKLRALARSALLVG